MQEDLPNQAEAGSFTVDGKRLVYEDSGGTGPVVVCVPGLGDSRAQFRLLTPKLVARSYRVIALDPRGQGESEAKWPSYAAHDTGADVAALIRKLALRDVTVIGNSAGAAAAVWAAAELPDRVGKIVLIGPFVRDIPLSIPQKILLRAGFAGPWATWLWGSYYRSLYPTNPPDDLDAYIARLKANLDESGRLAALRIMLFASKAPVEKRLAEVRARSLVIMGERDSDFPEPAVEAALVAGRVGGTFAMVAGAGHYPHVEFPDQTELLIAGFLHDGN